jgi:hypothetical protein
VGEIARKIEIEGDILLEEKRFSKREEGRKVEEERESNKEEEIV